MHDRSLEQYRDFLRDTVRQNVGLFQIDQNLGVAPPPLQKPVPPGGRRFDLPAVGQWTDVSGIGRGNGHRKSPQPSHLRPQASRAERIVVLALGHAGDSGQAELRHGVAHVPSAGARHALETYLAVSRVAGLEPAFYRYLPLEHQLLHLFDEPQMARRLTEGAMGQAFVGRAAVVFIWTTIPYRMEWRYGLAAHKAIALDAGHVCQNLYLACEAIGAATCAVGGVRSAVDGPLVAGRRFG